MPNRIPHCCLVALSLIAGTSVFAVDPKLTPQQQSKLEEAKSLNGQVEKLYSEGKFSDSARLAEKVLVICREVLGEKNAAYATGLSNLALQYDSMGNYAKAEQLYRQAISIDVQIQGGKSPEYATGLNNLAALYERMGEYSKAEPLYRQALAIDKEALGEKQPGYATELSNLAGLYDKMGDYPKAEPLLEQALAVKKETLGEAHPDYATSLQNLAFFYDNIGDYAKAEPLYHEAIAIYKLMLGEKHPLYANSLNNLGGMYTSVGDYASAEQLIRKALAIRKETLGAKHADYAMSLNSLALLYSSMGDYAKAEPLFRQATAVYKEALGEKHPDYASSINNLALLYVGAGNYAKAEPLFRQAATIYKGTLGEKHPRYANSLDNLGDLYRITGDYARAEPLLRQALAIRKETLGVKHADYATSLNNLAVLYENIGDYGKAEPLVREALSIHKEVFGERHASYATDLNNVADLYSSMGDHARAGQLYLQATAVYKDVLGEKHPNYAISLSNLAVSQAADQQWQLSAATFDQARHAVRCHVARVLPSLSEKEQAKFLEQTDNGPFHVALSLGLLRWNDAATTALSASWLANGKAVAQEALAQRARLAFSAADPQTADPARELLDARRRLAALAYTASKPGQEARRMAQLDELEAHESDLARRIAQTHGEDFQDDPWIDAAALRKAVPREGLLIDIARFEVFNFEAKGKEKKYGPAHYVAWLIPADGHGDVQINDLGDADKIDDAVKHVRSAMQQAVGDGQGAGTIMKAGESGAEKIIQKPLTELARLVWEPLAKAIPEDIREIILSPDSSLWLIPWGALPFGEKNGEIQTAIEKFNIRYVVSGRDLVNQQASSKLKPTQPVVMANPDYDLGPGELESATRSVLRGTQVAANDELRGLTAGKSQSLLPKVGRLAGTAAEAAAIKPKLEAYARQDVSTYLDQYATEGIFKALKHPKVLVMSTHGFFLPDQEVKHDEWGGLTQDPKHAAPVLTVDGKPIENPLLRCGLLLAGCNRSGEAAAPSTQPSPNGQRTTAPSPQPSPIERGSETAEDGILTGMEIVGTDLRGTELVVLSACETGLGDVHNGEGVAGLRQAFQLAGAKAVVATLWQIPDKDSSQIMSQFFTNLASGQSKSEALRNAQLAQIELHRQRFAAAHPFFWAAFTITGN